jgi:dynein assembly factor 1
MDSDSQHGGRQLTQAYLKDLFKKEWKLYYRTPELNEKLYLHYKGTHFSVVMQFIGFTKIQNLEQFTDLKCLYFEGNGKIRSFELEGVTKIEGL